MMSTEIFSGKHIFGSNFMGNQPISLFTVSKYLGALIIHQSCIELPDINKNRPINNSSANGCIKSK